MKQMKENFPRQASFSFRSEHFRLGLLGVCVLCLMTSAVWAGSGKFYRTEETRTFKFIQRGDAAGTVKALEKTPDWTSEAPEYFQTAVSSCQLEVLKLLVEKSGVDLKEKKGQFAEFDVDLLQTAASIEIDSDSDSRETDEQEVLEIVKWLVEQGCDLKRPRKDSDETSLIHTAIRSGNRLLTALLLENGISVEELEFDSTPLMTALEESGNGEEEDFQIAEILLKAGAKTVREKAEGDCLPFSLLHSAVGEGNLEKVEFLVKHGAPLECIYDGGTPLHAAVAGKAEEIVHFLVEKGANLEARTDFGWTPLLLAVLDDVEMARYLAESGADLQAVTDNDRDALFLAAENGNEALVDFFLEQKLDPRRVNLSGQGVLTAAACGGNFAIFKKFADMGLDLNTRDVWGQTLLFPAAAGGNAQIVEFLLAKGLKINEQRNDGLTAMDFVRRGENAAALVQIFRKAGGKETSNRAEMGWGAKEAEIFLNSFVPQGMGGMGGMGGGSPRNSFVPQGMGGFM